MQNRQERVAGCADPVWALHAARVVATRARNAQLDPAVDRWRAISTAAAIHVALIALAFALSGRGGDPAAHEETIVEVDFLGEAAAPDGHTGVADKAAVSSAPPPSTPDTSTATPPPIVDGDVPAPDASKPPVADPSPSDAPSGDTSDTATATAASSDGGFDRLARLRAIHHELQTREAMPVGETHGQAAPLSSVATSDANVPRAVADAYLLALQTTTRDALGAGVAVDPHCHLQIHVTSRRIDMVEWSAECRFSPTQAESIQQALRDLGALPTAPADGTIDLVLRR